MTETEVTDSGPPVSLFSLISKRAVMVVLYKKLLNEYSKNNMISVFYGKS